MASRTKLSTFIRKFHLTNSKFGVRTAKEGVPYKESIQKNKSVDLQQTLPKEADVVVIGGGSIGCNTLYHLAKLGITNAVLLEKHALTAGTTWHTAGLVWRLRPSDVEIQLLNHTRDVLTVLEDETGINPGWINNGGLFIASTKERLDEYKRLMTVGKAFGVDSHVLSPEETKKVHPLLNVDDVYATLYSPGDGTLEPAGFCTALTRAATRAGAKVIEGCSVTGIETEPTSHGCKVTAVVTPHGTIKTSKVVNCTGAWSASIARLVNSDIPLVPMRHAYVVTERIKGIENTPNVRDHDASVYMRLQGDALSIGGYEPNPDILDSVDPEFAFGLYELDWDIFGVHLERAIMRLPALETTGIKSTVCGPESFTPDHKPLMGEDVNVRGFYHGCGFNSAGMMLGGGCGRELARWVVDGRPTLDMYSYDIRRFWPKLCGNVAWAQERSHEAYAKNYSTVFAHDEPLASRNMRKGALHKILEDQGCIYQERHGWERPGWFYKSPSPVQSYDYYGNYGHAENQPNEYFDRLKDDYTFDFPKNHHQIASECHSCRNGAALFDMSYFGQFYITGPDAQKAADWIFSANMNQASGRTVYTCMLNARGGVESDLTVSILDSDCKTGFDPDFAGRAFYVGAGGAVATHNLAHMKTAVEDAKFNVKLVNKTDEMALISLQGPNSRKILQHACNDTCDLSDGSFPFSHHRLMQIAGKPVRAIRLTFVGEMGWELHTNNENVEAVYRHVMEVGREYGLVNAGYRAIESMSLEKGYRHWHADVRTDDNPMEAGLAFTCKLKTDTPFLGRTAIERLKKNGLRKRLSFFTLRDKIPLWGLEAIWRDDEVVGYLRRGEFAFALDKSIGCGYISKPDGTVVTKDFLKGGRQWYVEVMGKKYEADLHLKSPFDPENKRIMGIYD